MLVYTDAEYANKRCTFVKKSKSLIVKVSFTWGIQGRDNPIT